MLPATKSVPKELIPIVDKPALQYLVEECVKSGIEDIMIVISRGKTLIEDLLTVHPNWKTDSKRAARRKQNFSKP